MEKNALIEYNNVNILQQGLSVLDDVCLEIYKGEFIYLLGKVGSGKSSLLKSMYAELPIVEGEAHVLGYNLRNIRRKEVASLRRKLGIVFQDFQLLTDRNAHDNLAFVLRATGWKHKAEIQRQIEEVLKKVGMSKKAYKMSHQLSGGEQQRIGIARALLNTPELILADEPTGNLDPETGRDLVDLLYRISKEGTTVIMATHNLNWIEQFPGRVIRIQDEQLVENENGY